MLTFYREQEVVEAQVVGGGVPLEGAFEGLGDDISNIGFQILLDGVNGILGDMVLQGD